MVAASVGSALGRARQAEAEALRPARHRLVARLAGVVAVLLFAAGASAPLNAIRDQPAARARLFPVYDNMFFVGKPDTRPVGLIPSNIIYEGYIWPHDLNYGVLPTRAAFDAVVAAHSANPGPVVLDIERLPLKGDPATIQQHLRVLATLADWTRAAVHGKLVGFYGGNTLTNVAPQNQDYARNLAGHVDAFFPPMYAFDTNRTAWAQRAGKEAAEARSYGAHKPVYFYMWPQYHDGTPLQFQWIDAGYWRFQLTTAYNDADGIVLWGPGRFDWDDSSGWWAATVPFVRHPHPLATNTPPVG
jgi:hypothetical protein